MPSSGVIIHHPTASPEAQAAWNVLHTRLRNERPGYLLWAFGDDPNIVIQHLHEQPKSSIYRVVPFLIAPGKHLHEDVAQLERVLNKERPDIQLERAPVLLEDPLFLNAWLESL